MLTVIQNSENFTGRRGLLLWVILFLLNFLLRYIVYLNTSIFAFSDYAVYYNAVGYIADGTHTWLKSGNLLYAISYIGYFFQTQLGSIVWFFVMNCAAGSAATLIMSFLTLRITGKASAALYTYAMLTGYTEFMTFSSVFYTPVLMLFLLSLIIFLFRRLFIPAKPLKTVSYVLLIAVLFVLTFLFKPELKFLPFFLIAIAGIFYGKFPREAGLTVVTGLFMLLASFVFAKSGIITKPVNDTASNSFVFFGHTDYGGDGGEGTFIYKENAERYDSAFREYCARNNITTPGKVDYNSFQSEEIKKFILRHPFKWVKIQVRKFFRTFGIMPESTSFKVLYSGLFSGKKILSAFLVTAPFLVIFTLFIILFSKEAIGRLWRENRISHWFLIVYATFFLYYLIAVIFYGQYQERYRMPVMVMFTVPSVAYFITTFDQVRFLRRPDIYIRLFLLMLFISAWTVQVFEIRRHWDRYNSVILETGNRVSGNGNENR
jgi:hypothetical protein